MTEALDHLYIIAADAMIGILAFFLFGLAWLALRKMADVITKRRGARRRMNEPETHGDQGGWPTDASGYPAMLPKTMGQHEAYDDALNRYFTKSVS